MRKISIVLAALGATTLALPAWAQQGNSDGKAPQDKKGLDQAAIVLSEKDQGKLGLFVVTELDSGVRGKALADAIQQELAARKAAREAENPKGGKDDPSGKNASADKGPGEALQHGLSDKDLTNFGKFVNEQLASGLRGEELADAIQKKHEELKAARTAEHPEGHSNPPHHQRHRSAGHH